MLGRKALVVEWEKPAGPLHSDESWDAFAAQVLDRDAGVVQETGSAWGKHILANSDRQAVQQAEDSDDCPICDVTHNGEKVGEVI